MQFHPRDLSELDDLTEEHLGFSALSDGLGFGKKTGLRPGAPVDPEEAEEQADRKKQLAYSGIGAVAAGPAMPVLQKNIQVGRTVPASAASVLKEPAASPFLRLGAFAVDALSVLIPFTLAWRLSFRGEAVEIFLDNIAPPLFLYGVLLAAYFLLSESFGGQSLGKMTLNLQVVEDDKYQKPIGLKHTAARLVVLVLGTVALGLGLFAAFRDPKRRPWHDRFTGSIVRRKG